MKVVGKGVYTRKLARYRVVATNASIPHCGGVSVLYCKAEQFTPEVLRLHIPKFVIFHLEFFVLGGEGVMSCGATSPGKYLKHREHCCSHQSAPQRGGVSGGRRLQRGLNKSVRQHKGWRYYGGTCHCSPGGHGRPFPSRTKYVFKIPADGEHNVLGQGGAVSDRIPVEMAILATKPLSSDGGIVPSLTIPTNVWHTRSIWRHIWYNFMSQNMGSQLQRYIPPRVTTPHDTDYISSLQFIQLQCHDLINISNLSVPVL